MPHHPAAPPSGGRPPSPPAIPLLLDGSLTLRVHPAVAHAAASWIPLPQAEPSHPAPAVPAARIRVVPVRTGAADVPGGEPTLEVVRVRAWLGPDARRMRLAGPEGGVRGVVDLARGRATLGVPARAPVSQAEEFDVACALTVAAAMLLGRAGRVLLHAAAPVAPDGRAWLLVGDTLSGKTSSCVNLIRAGWDWLADDQAVAYADVPTGQVVVEGWPRPFTLDDGFEAGRSLGVRSPADPGRFGPGRLLRAAPLGGILLPRVRADEPTRVEPAHPADALAQLIRQAPWLLADPHAAPGVLALLARMAKTAVFRMSVGADTYADPQLLQARVSEAVRDADSARRGGKRL